MSTTIDNLFTMKESEYLEQPYKVKKVEKVITKTEITYEPEGE